MGCISVNRIPVYSVAYSWGIVLAVVPFILSLLLNIESLGMPDKFREYDEVWNSMISSVCILIITLP